jgi:hypothetical protein
MNDHLAVTGSMRRTRPAYRLRRTEIWANGLAPSGMQAFIPNDFDRTVGAKLQPFHDLNFKVGTALTRSGGDDRLLSSAATWEAFWSKELEPWEGVTVGLSTSGSLDNLQSAYSQSVRGTFGIPLDLPLDAWRTEFRLSPSMILDASSGSLAGGLLSEIKGQTVISSRDDPFRSVLNVKVGYGLAPDTRPVASAKLELRISPNL